MKLLIVVERTETGFSAHSPDLPGCIATGPNRQSVEQEMRDAIALHLEGMRAAGCPPCIGRLLDMLDGEIL